MSHVDYVFATRNAAAIIRDFCETFAEEISSADEAAGVFVPFPTWVMHDAQQAHEDASDDAPGVFHVEYPLDFEEHIHRALDVSERVVELSCGDRILVLWDGKERWQDSGIYHFANLLNSIRKGNRFIGTKAPEGVCFYCKDENAIFDLRPEMYAWGVRYGGIDEQDGYFYLSRGSAVDYAEWRADGSIIIGENVGIFRLLSGQSVEIMF